MNRRGFLARLAGAAVAAASLPALTRAAPTVRETLPAASSLACEWEIGHLQGILFHESEDWGIAPTVWADSVPITVWYDSKALNDAWSRRMREMVDTLNERREEVAWHVLSGAR